jgi:hypothetical protein
LRLAEPELLHAARSLGLDVSVLVVRTASAPLQPPGPAERPAVPMSKAACDALQAALDSLRDAPGDSSSPGGSARRKPGRGTA